jgi:predicted GIY-YIG superfamily endonuclease
MIVMNMDARRGVTILVFLAEGSPDGLRVVERSNWTGVVLLAGIAEPAVLLERPELDGPGVYMLVGRSGDEARHLYIGEADDVGKRIRQHLAKADESWQQILVATRKDTSLNKAHVRWLERELIEIARRAKRSTISNVNAGFASRLHEAEVATMESYLDELLTILPILGIDAFQIAESAPRESRSLTYLLRGAGGVEAEGYETASGFTVSSGVTRGSHVASTARGTVLMRERLLSEGVFEIVGGDTWRLSSPFLFDSPSTAAAVMLGRSANGLVEWKTIDGTTLKSVRQAEALRAK